MINEIVMFIVGFVACWILREKFDLNFKITKK
jgi:hypothetical protein